jgi:hypothetical protein
MPQETQTQTFVQRLAQRLIDLGVRVDVADFIAGGYAPSRLRLNGTAIEVLREDGAPYALDGSVKDPVAFLAAQLRPLVPPVLLTDQARSTESNRLVEELTKANDARSAIANPLTAAAGTQR